MKEIKIVVTTDPKETQVIIKAETLSEQESEEREYYFDPDAAAALTRSLIEAAKKCGYEEPPTKNYRPFTDTQRLMMIKRVEHVFRSLSGRKIDFICTHVVDTILAEVL